MNLITVNGEQFISKLNTQSKSELGDLGEATHVVESKIQPKTLPFRKLPLAIKDRVKAELYSLIDRGILIPLTHTYEMGKSNGNSTQSQWPMAN